MKSAVADKEVEMTEWNDGRLDDLSKRMDEGFLNVEKRFEQVDKRFEQVDKRFEQVDRRFGQIDLRLDGLQHLLVRIAWTYGLGMLAFAGALLGLIAGKL